MELPTGSLMWFRQSVAPFGWTKIKTVQKDPIIIILARKD